MNENSYTDIYRVRFVETHTQCLVSKRISGLKSWKKLEHLDICPLWSWCPGGLGFAMGPGLPETEVDAIRSGAEIEGWTPEEEPCSPDRESGLISAHRILGWFNWGEGGGVSYESVST